MKYHSKRIYIQRNLNVIEIKKMTGQGAFFSLYHNYDLLLYLLKRFQDKMFSMLKRFLGLLSVGLTNVWQLSHFKEQIFHIPRSDVVGVSSSVSTWRVSLEGIFILYLFGRGTPQSVDSETPKVFTSSVFFIHCGPTPRRQKEVYTLLWVCHERPLEPWPPKRLNGSPSHFPHFSLCPELSPPAGEDKGNSARTPMTL